MLQGGESHAVDASVHSAISQLSSAICTALDLTQVKYKINMIRQLGAG